MSGILTEPAPTQQEEDSLLARSVRRGLQQTIRRVSDDLDGFRFNTMIAALMEFTTVLSRAKASGQLNSEVLREGQEGLVLMMAPSAPHIAEELWSRLGHQRSVHLQPWPEYDAELAREDEITLVVQVNGKLRERLTVAPGLGEDEAVAKALESPRVATAIGDWPVKRAVYRPDSAAQPSNRLTPSLGFTRLFQGVNSLTHAREKCADLGVQPRQDGERIAISLFLLKPSLIDRLLQSGRSAGFCIGDDLARAVLRLANDAGVSKPAIRLAVCRLQNASSFLLGFCNRLSSSL